ncbi:MAG: hypothetical protein HRU19_06990 [Pseudobacteriovorax sp.]|nr:hypothetical protein [Pseudobacteriovorax sp.]
MEDLEVVHWERSILEYNRIFREGDLAAALEGYKKLFQIAKDQIDWFQDFGDPQNLDGFYTAIDRLIVSSHNIADCHEARKKGSQTVYYLNYPLTLTRKILESNRLPEEAQSFLLKRFQFCHVTYLTYLKSCRCDLIPKIDLPGLDTSVSSSEFH